MMIQFIEDMFALIGFCVFVMAFSVFLIYETYTPSCKLALAIFTKECLK